MTVIMTMQVAHITYVTGLRIVREQIQKWYEKIIHFNSVTFAAAHGSRT
jgi:hypothetical protein